MAEAGWKVVALTNGSEESTRKLLDRVGVLQDTSIFSCDTIQKTKPHPDVYALPKQDTSGDIWMVAAYAWDIIGAARAGLKTAFITQEGISYLSIYPQHEIIASNLVEAANKIIKA